MSEESQMQRSKNDISPNTYSSLLESGQMLTTENSLRNLGSIAQAIIYQNMGREDLIDQMKLEKSPEYLYIQNFEENEQRLAQSDEAAREYQMAYTERQYKSGLLQEFTLTPEKEILQNKFVAHQTLEKEAKFVIPDKLLRNEDAHLVGGKCASLGELINNIEGLGISVPSSFATSAKMYNYVMDNTYLEKTGISLGDSIKSIFADYSDSAIDMKTIEIIHKRIYELYENISIPKDVEELIISGYYNICQEYNVEDLSVAVRSSSTGEDLPDASSAGQQLTELNVKGSKQLISAVINCMKSLYTERAISYRHNGNQPQFGSGSELCIAVQKMARSDIGASFVGFSSNAANRDINQATITLLPGIGENLVGGNITPDQHLTKIIDGKTTILNTTIGGKQEQMVFNDELSRIKPFSQRLNFLKIGEKPEKRKLVKNIPVSRDIQQAQTVPDEVIIRLGEIAKNLEEHYTKISNKFTPMDFEGVVTEVIGENDTDPNLVYASNGKKYKIELVQARPITTGEEEYNLRQQNKLKFTKYGLTETETSFVEGGVKNNQVELFKGIVAQNGAVVGAPVIIENEKPTINDLDTILKIANMSNNEVVLIVEKTDPDSVPLLDELKRLNIKFGIFALKGGRTSHATIVCRERGVPAIVGGENLDMGALNQLINGKSKDGKLAKVTLFAGGTEQDGLYLKEFEYEAIEQIVDLPTKKNKVPIKFIVGDASLLPDQTYNLPFIDGGVGLFRLEILAAKIGIHPEALRNFDKLDRYTQVKILEKVPLEYRDRLVDWETKQYVDEIITASLAVYPQRNLVRLPDFKSNEYLNLIGGARFEPTEENPMLGERGAFRYIKRQEWFQEQVCRVIKEVSEKGIKNMDIMIPFVRTPKELEQVLQMMSNAGVKPEMYGKLYIMCELPANIVMADEYLDVEVDGHRVKGFSIGTNDLTQLTHGTDRDSSSKALSESITSSNPAVKKLVLGITKHLSKKGIEVGLCGNAVYEDPQFAEELVKAGISSMSVTADAEVGLTVHQHIAKAEREMATAA
jgi:pyruvate, water dikinase